METGRDAAGDSKRDITLVAVGDVSPNREEPASIFRYCVEEFRKADIVFGQNENCLSDRGTLTFTPHTACKASPDNIRALTEEGADFDVMSFASNHAVDFGWDAFYDTLDILEKHRIPIVGAGRNIEEARRPVIIERDGTKVGFLAYLSIVSLGLVAEENIPGCAPLRATTLYQQVDFQPGTPPLIVTKCWPEDLRAMVEDVEKLRSQVDVLVVSMHAGVHFVPEIVAQYQKEASYAAIDAGADLVLQHHAHILKGIEMYKGKAIFYSLGNFALEHTRQLVGTKYKAWDPFFRQTRKFYKIKPLPGWEGHWFHPDALKTIIAKAYIRDKKIHKVTFIPAFITPNLEPEVVRREDPRGQAVFDYVKQITENEELKASFTWDGDEVLVSAQS